MSSGEAWLEYGDLTDAMGWSDWFVVVAVLAAYYWLARWGWRYF